MKKTILVILVLFAAMTAKAQWYVGGGINGELFESHKTMSLNPDFGYTLKNAPFGFGLASLFYFQQAEPDGNPLRLDVICISPYFRYYFYEIERFYFFTDMVCDVNVFGEFGWDVGLLAGVSFNITEHWSAEFNYGWIGYEQFEEKGISFLMDASTVRFAFYYNF